MRGQFIFVSFQVRRSKSSRSMKDKGGDLGNHEVGNQIVAIQSAVNSCKRKTLAIRNNLRESSKTK
jgi:hypothetical protein